MANYPKDIEYHQYPEGRSVRCPRGKISKCPCCGRNGLRQVSSWSRGRYHITYWHVATQFGPDDTIAQELCSIKKRTLAKLPTAEQEKGREG